MIVVGNEEEGELVRELREDGGEVQSDIIRN